MKFLETHSRDDDNSHNDDNDSNNDEYNDRNDDNGLEIPSFDVLGVAHQVDIVAFVKAKGLRPAGRGAKGRFVRSPGGRGQLGARAMPPRGCADMTFVNRGRSGHAASECRKGRKEKTERMCFTCNKPGHLATNWPQ